MKTSKRICKNGSITLPKQIRGEAGFRAMLLTLKQVQTALLQLNRPLPVVAFAAHSKM